MATLALVPGADGHSWYWHRLAPILVSHGHEVVTMDMPSVPTAGLADYASAVTEAIGGRRRDLVIVAQSIGGFSGTLACDRIPVDLLVLVNAMVPAPGESAGQWWGNVGHDQARADDAARVGRAPDSPFDLRFEFFHDVPEAVTEEALAPEPSSPSDQFFADPWPLDRWPAVRTVFLQGRDDRFLPIEFQRRVVRDRLGIEIRDIPGGHLNALSQPEALAAAIEDTIASGP